MLNKTLIRMAQRQDQRGIRLVTEKSQVWIPVRHCYATTSRKLFTFWLTDWLSVTKQH